MHEDAINKKIAETILRAQNASDGGKKFDMLSASKKAFKDNAVKYRRKDQMVRLAIEMIARNRGRCDFHYSVVNDPEGITYYIVYFETRLGYVRYQVSFHSFDCALEKYVCKSFRMKWDRDDSRESAAVIYRYYVPNGQYIE